MRWHRQGAAGILPAVLPLIGLPARCRQRTGVHGKRSRIGALAERNWQPQMHANKRRLKPEDRRQRDYKTRDHETNRLWTFDVGCSCTALCPPTSDPKRGVAPTGLLRSPPSDVRLFWSRIAIVPCSRCPVVPWSLVLGPFLRPRQAGRSVLLYAFAFCPSPARAAVVG